MKITIGTIKLDRDTEMTNTQFSYAADFETLIVPKGEYTIYADSADLEIRNGRVYLGWRNYIGYEGTVKAGNVGDRVKLLRSFGQETSSDKDCEAPRERRIM